MNYTVPHITLQHMRISHYYLAPENGPTGMMVSIIAIFILSALWKIVSLLRSIAEVDPREREIREVVMEDDSSDETNNDNVEFQLVDDSSESDNPSDRDVETFQNFVDQANLPENATRLDFGYHRDDGKWISRDDYRDDYQSDGNYVPISMENDEMDVELNGTPPRRSKRLSEKSERLHSNL